MKKVKLAVVGVGNMGSSHCRDIDAMEQGQLVCICDIDRSKADEFAEKYQCKAYYSTGELFASGGFEGVIIATPHYDHTTIALEAFDHGIHVLTEKPVGVHVKDIKKMIAAYKKAKEKKEDLVFSAMFQQRTRGPAKKIKDLLDSGELGKLIRTTWIITNWYRTQSYYNSGGWRATWKGEGGGVLMNQCPHQLDMFQWFVGCPDRIRGFASLGKYHDIEVEDEVTAYFEYDKGMVGHFITTTGEAPGTNRLEIVGEKGKLIWEGSDLTFYRNRESLLKHLQTATKGFEQPECWECKIPFEEKGGEHSLIINNFCDAIAEGTELIAPAEEGLNSIAMNNAIMISSFENRMVELPLDENAFETKLKELIKGSTFQKDVVANEREDFTKSF
jgi:predicted dehydrogenase